MRYRKPTRREFKDTVLNLCDLNFSVSAIAYLTNKSPANVYAHLKTAGRLGNRSMIRHYPTEVTPQAKVYIAKAFPENPSMVHLLLGAAQAGWDKLTITPAVVPASVTRAASKASAKKHK